MPTALVIDRSHGQIPLRLPDADPLPMHTIRPSPAAHEVLVMGATVDHGRRHRTPHPLPLGKEINIPGPQEPTINLSQGGSRLDPLGDTDERPHRIQLQNHILPDPQQRYIRFLYALRREVVRNPTPFREALTSRYGRPLHARLTRGSV